MNINKKLGVAFVWHMHQPYYKDPLTGKFLMPWVRLHGIKDYYPMALLVDNFDEARVVFNLVPSLVEQINDYVHNNASDTFLDLTVKKASSLTFEEKVAVLSEFFKVNFKNFIEPNPRYAELLIKKGVNPASGSALNRIVKSFSGQDILDLQALFNLSWFHSLTIDEDINLKDLAGKGRGYTEEDKEYIVARQKDVLGRILPLYRKLSEEGRVELTTTPFYHPIMPLLCDTSTAAVSLPGAPLPKRRFSHPEDAAWHVEQAIKYHAEQFGAPPAGMWPSEGSVSDEVLDILISKGIGWVATDEDILFKTLSKDASFRDVELFDRRLIYRPYAYGKGKRHIGVIFRDKNLSDMISFSYNSWDQSQAAWDLIGHLNRIAENLRRDTDRGLVNIIMDGENAWEYFRDNGRTFFETLYANIDRQENIASTTVSDFLDMEPPRKKIARIYPGSWINHNFDIWIGQEQDNISWEYLYRVRKDLEAFTKEFHRRDASGDKALKDAWKEFYISEGSDWNWWYGGKARTGGDNPFDKLYRTHLKNVYKVLKKPVPDFLKISIA